MVEVNKMAKYINEEVLLNNAVVDKYVVIDKQMFEWLSAERRCEYNE